MVNRKAFIVKSLLNWDFQFGKQMAFNLLFYVRTLETIRPHSPGGQGDGLLGHYESKNESFEEKLMDVLFGSEL